VYVSNYAGVFTWHNDNSRTGANTGEIALTPTNVNFNTFGKLFTTAVDGYVYAQPLYVANVSVAGSSHNVLYVATEHDSLYALDADTGNILWQKSYIDPANGITPIPSPADTSCGDLVPEVGITSTPVIDPSTKTLYLLARTKESGQYFQRLHAVDISTGAEKFGGPKIIQATVPGSGLGSSGGQITFDPLIQNQRSALLLDAGHVVIAWTSHCDLGSYHGWLMSYNAGTLAQEQVANLSPNSDWASIWMSGSGPAADANGNIYFATANGGYDGITEFGDSIVRMPAPSSSGTWAPADWFTPWNQVSLSIADLDLGSGGVLLLPDLSNGKQLLVQAGKDGLIHLLDRNNMGKFCTTCTSTNTNIVQEINGVLNGLWSSPAFWNNTLYFGPAIDDGSGDTLKAVPFNAGGSGLLATSPSSTSAKTFNFSSPTPVISSNGNTGGVLWAVDNSQFSSGSCCQTLYAYDASNLGSMLYNSAQAPGNRDVLGAAVKFSVPIVANGKVYIGGQGSVSAFGLASLASPAAAPVFAPLPGTYSSAQSVSITDATPGAQIYYTTDGSLPTTNSTLYSAPISVSSDTTIRALAVANAFAPTQSSATYSINPAANGIDFSYGFAGAGTGFTLNGSASINGTRIRLTDNGSNEASSAFFGSQVPIGTFTADFTFQISDPFSDGMTFTIQSVGPTALGAPGGGLGYGPDTVGGTGAKIANSLAIKFDLYNNQGEGSNSTGVYLNGASPTTPAVDLTPSGINLHSGGVFQAHVTYDGSNLVLKITQPGTTNSFSQTWTGVNLAATLGSSNGYVGFTAGTGGYSQVAEIISFKYHN
jgi:hypothetical protein